MKKPPAFQVYARDFLLDDTAQLTLAATGAFERLRCHQWLEGSLPPEVARLAKLAGTTSKRFRTIWREIARLFPLDINGRRRNPGLDEQRAELDEYRSRQADLGRQGARARWLRPLP